MKKILAALILGGLLCMPLARADDNGKPSPRTISPNRVSIFQVPFT